MNSDLKLNTVVWQAVVAWCSDYREMRMNFLQGIRHGWCGFLEYYGYTTMDRYRLDNKGELKIYAMIKVIYRSKRGGERPLPRNEQYLEMNIMIIMVIFGAQGSME